MRFALLALVLSLAHVATAAPPPLEEHAQLAPHLALTSSACTRPESPAMPAPTLGRIVHYCIAKAATGEPVLRPALVVNDWGSSAPEHVNLAVHVDFGNDVRYREHAQLELNAYNAAHPELSDRALNPTLDGKVVEELSRLEDTRSVAPDAQECERGVAWRTSVSEGDGVGQFRWPALVPPAASPAAPAVS